MVPSCSLECIQLVVTLAGAVSRATAATCGQPSSRVRTSTANWCGPTGGTLPTTSAPLLPCRGTSSWHSCSRASPPCPCTGSRSPRPPSSPSRGLQRRRAYMPRRRLPAVSSGPHCDRCSPPRATVCATPLPSGAPTLLSLPPVPGRNWPTFRTSTAP